nr:hypothetical protein [Verrucomicrobiota bacterium]
PMPVSTPRATKRRPFASKLLPFEELIRELRASNVSYHAIAQYLETEHGMKVHRDTINSFVIVRAKRPSPLVYTLPPKREPSAATAAVRSPTPAPPPVEPPPAADPSADTAAPKPRKWNAEF